MGAEILASGVAVMAAGLAGLGVSIWQHCKPCSDKTVTVQYTNVYTGVSNTVTSNICRGYATVGIILSSGVIIGGIIFTAIGAATLDK